MMADLEMVSELEAIHFKYQRINSLISCIQKLVAEVVGDVCELPKNALDYSLYEIENGICENNKALGMIIDRANLIERKTS